MFILILGGVCSHILCISFLVFTPHIAKKTPVIIDRSFLNHY
ncbi:hypothetical protein GYO_3034 [Bacillus spizizenii TU-B-10]|uniref:Uncharacterized protein n=1 Tax=Bacillus spizizenii (strain DSM 15029 / JCM 12233 / NBRC 101239 / NRRL B-23049 / TU-B-10) TaxID=1052585 RepID=G4NYC9_BACS4|nr:hypothetical protein GYO_3034 [Bacillus spizizenii TU-B-10]